MAKFRKKPAIVEAIRITQPMAMDTETGIAKGQGGDWLIISMTGEEYFISHATFRLLFEPANEEAVEYLREVASLYRMGFYNRNELES